MTDQYRRFVSSHLGWAVASGLGLPRPYVDGQLRVCGQALIGD